MKELAFVLFVGDTITRRHAARDAHPHAITLSAMSLSYTHILTRACSMSYDTPAHVSSLCPAGIEHHGAPLAAVRSSFHPNNEEPIPRLPR